MDKRGIVGYYIRKNVILNIHRGEKNRGKESWKKYIKQIVSSNHFDDGIYSNDCTYV